MKCQIFNSDSKFGLINEHHEIILPAIYDNIVFDFQEEYALTRKDGKWGMASKEGDIICECIYDTVHLDFVASNYACVGNASKDGIMLYGLINKKGELTCDCQFNYIDSTPIVEDRFIIGMLWIDEVKKQKKTLYGLINHKGKMIQPCLYDSKDKLSEAVQSGLIK